AARARLVSARKARHSSWLTTAWLARLRKPGRRWVGRNGEGNSRVGVIGIIPAPIAGMRRNSAAEKPTNAASPLTISASQPRAAPTVVLSHEVALALAMFASARVVRVTPAP